jgi:hypothetical protein
MYRIITQWRIILSATFVYPAMEGISTGSLPKRWVEMVSLPSRCQSGLPLIANSGNIREHHRYCDKGGIMACTSPLWVIPEIGMGGCVQLRP